MYVERNVVARSRDHYFARNATLYIFFFTLHYKQIDLGGNRLFKIEFVF